MTPRSDAPVSSSGRIEVITGCMFSGKTEELLRRLRRAEIADQEVEVFKPSVDDRYSEEEVGSHSGRTWGARVVNPESKNLEERFLEPKADVVAVDEANFFEPSLVPVLEKLSGSGTRVIVTGLDQTFRGEPFTPVPELMARAEYVDKLRAICARCGGEATKTQRMIDGEPAHVDDPTILVGADESYEARCRECHEVRTE
ncbi:MAG: thymidine kinase [Candidatus Nanosalina sp.]